LFACQLTFGLQDKWVSFDVISVKRLSANRENDGEQKADAASQFFGQHLKPQ
jgi:hypothetical protein